MTKWSQNQVYDFYQRSLSGTLYVVFFCVTFLQWLHKVTLPNRTPIKVATMLNDAGIIGAALASLARAAFETTRKPQQVDDYLNA